MRVRICLCSASLVILALLPACAAFAAPPPAAPAAGLCPNPQSPRVLDHYDQHPTFTVTPVHGVTDAVTYTRRSDGRQFVLRRCGQHYHCQIENVQPRCGQHGAAGTCGPPAPDSWVEIHTVFSSKPLTAGCDPEALDCCASQHEGDPVLVLGYSAKVTATGPPLLPIPVPWGTESAQWSGSTTGTKPPEPCKDPAQWDFILGCGFTVSTRQLAGFTKFDQSRALQHQVSNDLTHNPPR